MRKDSQRSQREANHKRPERLSKHQQHNPTKIPAHSRRHQPGNNDPQLTTFQQFFCVFVTINLLIHEGTALSVKAARGEQPKQKGGPPSKNASAGNSTSMLTRTLNNTNSLSNVRIAPPHATSPLLPIVTPPANSLIACDESDYCVAIAIKSYPRDGVTCFNWDDCNFLDAYISNNGQKTWIQTVEKLSIVQGDGHHQLNEIACAPPVNMEYCVAVGKTFTSTYRDDDFRTLIITTLTAGHSWHPAEGGITACSAWGPWQAEFNLVVPAGERELVAAGTCAPDFSQPDFHLSRPLVYTSKNRGISWQPSAIEPISATTNSGNTYVKEVECFENRCFLTGKAISENPIIEKPFRFFSNDSGTRWREIVSPEPKQERVARRP